jgi:hypothetical protein
MAITLCITSQQMFFVVGLYFVVDSVRKLLDTPSYDPNYEQSCKESIMWRSYGSCHVRASVYGNHTMTILCVIRFEGYHVRYLSCDDHVNHVMWGSLLMTITRRPYYCDDLWCHVAYEDMSISFWTGRLERELQMVQLSASRCSCIAILWVSLVSFATIILCVASQRVFVIYFVIDSVRKLLNTRSYYFRIVSKMVPCTQIWVIPNHIAL